MKPSLAFKVIGTTVSQGDGGKINRLFYLQRADGKEIRVCHHRFRDLRSQGRIIDHPPMALGKYSHIFTSESANNALRSNRHR